MTADPPRASRVEVVVPRSVALERRIATLPSPVGPAVSWAALPLGHGLRIACLVGLLISASAPAHAQRGATLEFELAVHVARDSDGAPVLDDHALGTWVDRVNALFAPASIAFDPGVPHQLAHGTAELHTIRDRHALARHLEPRRINVFVVAAIHDPTPSETTRRAAAHQGFEPSGRLAGAHIRVVNRRPDTFIVVIARGDGTSLAHELGHFFGAPHHADPANVMSYGARRERFDAHQLRVFAMFARRFARDRTVRVSRVERVPAADAQTPPNRAG